jgi:hypothetical protein
MAFRVNGNIVIDDQTAITTTGISTSSNVNLNGSFYTTIDADGVISSGTYKPQLSPSNIKSITNSGNFILSAPDAINSTTAYSMLVYITNSGTAGTITTSGFNLVTGDVFTTTSGHVFFVYITVVGTGAKVAVVMAAQ